MDQEILKTDDSGRPTVFLWRETPEEKAERLADLQAQARRAASVRHSLSGRPASKSELSGTRTVS